MQNITPFPVQLRYERERCGWSQAELASKIGSDSRTVARWENGKSWPRPYLRRALCDVFQRDAEAFGLLSGSQATGDPVPLATAPAVGVQEKEAPSDMLSNAETDARIYQNILGFPPPTHPGTIQQREKMVQAISQHLLQAQTTALVLTGIGGIGKSTLAALVYRYTLEQYQRGESPFAAPPLWLTVNENATMSNLVGTLLEAFGKALPDLGRLTPQAQVLTLFHAFNAPEKARLIVLDQFENVLDWQTGYALPERPGIGEWLDALNGQPCACKILLTSRPWPKGTRDYPETQMHDYPIIGLEIMEGVALLRTHGIQEKQATTRQLQVAVERCDGHAFALILLASLLRQNRSLNLTLLFEHSLYQHLWYGDIAHNLLDYIYLQQLNSTQRELLVAFSLYREPVPLEACLALTHFSATEQYEPVLSALRVLLTQHLLQACGDALYQLHVIVSNYAQGRKLLEHQQAAVFSTHSRAARYYLEQSLPGDRVKGQRKGIHDIQPFIEASWHLCQAQLWQDAFNLIQREEIYFDLRRWGGNATILELYLLLFPLERWCQSPTQEAVIFDQLGRVYGTLGKKELALEYYERALRLYQMQGNRQGECRTLNHLASVQENLGKGALARELHAQALALGQSFGDRKGEADALNGLAWIAHLWRQEEEALAYYKQALVIYRETANDVGESDALNGMGLVYQATGEKQRAFQLIEQALHLRRTNKDRMGEGRTLNNLGLLYADLGQEDQAYRCYRQSFLIRKETGDRHGEGVVLYNIGKICYRQKQFAQALACWLQAREIFAEVQSTQQKAVQRWMNELQRAVEPPVFTELLTMVAAPSSRLLEQAVQGNLNASQGSLPIP